MGHEIDLPKAILGHVYAKQNEHTETRSVQFSTVILGPTFAISLPKWDMKWIFQSKLYWDSVISINQRKRDMCIVNERIILVYCIVFEVDYEKEHSSVANSITGLDTGHFQNWHTCPPIGVKMITQFEGRRIKTVPLQVSTRKFTHKLRSGMYNLSLSLSLLFFFVLFANSSWQNFECWGPHTCPTLNLKVHTLNLKVTLNSNRWSFHVLSRYTE